VVAEVVVLLHCAKVAVVMQDYVVAVAFLDVGQPVVTLCECGIGQTAPAVLGFPPLQVLNCSGIAPTVCLVGSLDESVAT